MKLAVLPKRACAAAAAWTLCALALARPAVADNPYDRLQAKRAAQVLKLGRSPRAALPLLRLWRDWERSDASRTLALLHKLEGDRRLSPPLRVSVARLLALGQLRTGQFEEAFKRLDALGYARFWRVVGPFDNEGKSSFDRDLPPELHSEQPPKLEQSFEGRERAVRWRTPPTTVPYGYVSFDSLLHPRTNVCGLAETVVYSDAVRPLTLWVGAAGAVKVYWNGEPVLRDPAYRGSHPDRAVTMVGAHKGPNRILVKVCVAEGAWGFFLRLGDRQGGVARGLRYAVVSAPPKVIRGHGVARLPKPPVASLDALEQAAARPRAKAQALEDLARFLHYTRADDPAERRAKQLAARAADQHPTLERLMLASSLAEERGERMRFAAEASKRFGKRAGARFLTAHVTVAGPAPEEALPLLESLEEARGTTEAVRAKALRASILSGLGLEHTSLSVVQELARQLPASVWAVRLLAESASSAGQSDASYALRRRLLELRPDDTRTRRILLADAVERGDARAAQRHLDVIAMLDPDSLRTKRYLAGVYDALGREDLALQMHQEAIAQAPDDPQHYVGYAKALLRGQQSDAAADYLRKALALRPQDKDVRELLEQLRPQRRPDESYAVEPAVFLARRRAHARYSTRVLHDLTVNTVYPNGLGSSFQQYVFQVHDKEGARQQRTYSIRFDPATQRVDLRLARVYRGERQLEAVQTYESQLGEPWYRIYYDTRALVVVFPDLEPGDTVELRYRVDDVAHRNLFADYYGGVKLFQSMVPVSHAEYVLITPTSRKFYFHKPELPKLQFSERVEGTQRIYRVLAEEVPAIHAEAGMPGIAEVSPYLHVSTYRSWQDVGRWYWGLIKDQLYADSALKQTLRDLMKGATTTRDKVVRIHNWVVRNTRYVALEFGIHGYLPYRVPLIVQRGFGDCKDKASLMYTMMREAGVEAEIVLVRTRRNGRLKEWPASLAVFDHAIAYVPELKLYLDGTAEHSGTAELPWQDQGVMVLHVGPKTASVRRTPTLPANLNQRQRALRVALSEDGSAHLLGKEVVTGAEAAGYRDYYQAPGTRKERLERALAGLYPGVKLASQSFEQLEDLEDAVRYSYDARVPQMGRWDGKEMRVAPSSLSNLVRAYARRPSRRYALDLHTASSYVEERALRLPAGLRAASVPAGGEARSRFGRLRLRFEHHGDEVVGHTEFEVNHDRVDPEEYPAFRRWVEQADVLLRQRIVLRRRQE